MPALQNRLPKRLIPALIAIIVTTSSSTFPLSAAEQKDLDASLRVNQIQVIGTHNSYHAGLASSQARLVEQSDPALARALDYKHPGLDVQLSHGARLLEFGCVARQGRRPLRSPKGVD